MTNTPWTTLCLLAAVLCMIDFVGAGVGADEPLTYIVTSDSHYETSPEELRNIRNGQTVEEMNRITDRRWPEQLGGEPISKPAGVLALGDLIDDGDRRGDTAAQWQHYLRDFGLTGEDGKLQYRVFDGWGNHDGPPIGKSKSEFNVQEALRKRNRTRLEKGWIDHLSDNELHYSWDWHGIHFVQLNLYPSDQPHPDTRYNKVWHDPQGALSFLVDDLKQNVGDSGRPVVLLAHYGFDTPNDWWQVAEWETLYEKVKPYNIAAYFHGHTGTKVYRWGPEGDKEFFRTVNTGQTENGFFVVRMTADAMQVAYRVNVAKKDQPPRWEWKHTSQWPLKQTSSAAAQAE